MPGSMLFTISLAIYMANSLGYSVIQTHDMDLVRSRGQAQGPLAQYLPLRSCVIDHVHVEDVIA